MKSFASLFLCVFVSQASCCPVARANPSLFLTTPIDSPPQNPYIIAFTLARPNPAGHTLRERATS